MTADPKIQEHESYSDSDDDVPDLQNVASGSGADVFLSFFSNCAIDRESW